MSTEAKPRQRHKPGPKPIAADRFKASFLISKDLWDWLAEQPEGASRLLRMLAEAERQRRERASA